MSYLRRFIYWLLCWSPADDLPRCWLCDAPGRDQNTDGHCDACGATWGDDDPEDD